jgi:hypothetical protein
MKLLLLIVTVVSLFLLKAKANSPTITEMSLPRQFINIPTSILVSKNNEIADRLSSITADIQNLTNQNNLLVEQIDSVRNLIALLSLDIKIIPPSQPTEDVFTDGGLGEYVQQLLQLIDPLLPCYSLLNSVFTQLSEDIENYTYNGELNTYIDNTVIESLQNSLANRDSVETIKTKIFNIINTCITKDVQPDPVEPQPI